VGEKSSFNTYVHNVWLNWVKFNRESRDLRWRSGCWLFVYYLCRRITRSSMRLHSFLVQYTVAVDFLQQFVQTSSAKHVTL